MHRMMARGTVKKDQIVSVYRSETFPTAAFGLAHNLKPRLATKIREAFFNYPWTGSGLEKEFSSLGVSKFVPITYKKDWAVIRKIDAAMNVSYACN
jgi:phosphonate transport system substrate-binding protein